jgi:hypothetical protein
VFKKANDNKVENDKKCQACGHRLTTSKEKWDDTIMSWAYQRTIKEHLTKIKVRRSSDESKICLKRPGDVLTEDDDVLVLQPPSGKIPIFGPKKIRYIECTNDKSYGTTNNDDNNENSIGTNEVEDVEVKRPRDVLKEDHGVLVLQPPSGKIPIFGPKQIRYIECTYDQNDKSNNDDNNENSIGTNEVEDVEVKSPGDVLTEDHDVLVLQPPSDIECTYDQQVAAVKEVAKEMLALNGSAKEDVTSGEKFSLFEINRYLINLYQIIQIIQKEDFWAKNRRFLGI